MKYNKIKSILTLLTVSFCLSATAQEVVNVRLCDETAPFLIGCSQFSTTDTYSVDVDGTTKTLNLIYGHSSPATELKDTIEAGQTYLFACQQLSGAAGAELTASETFTNVTGCDSVVNLKLKVKAPIEPECDTAKVTLNDSIIAGESYLFGCQILTEEGTYVDNLTKLDGSCDSIVTLNLKFYVAECDTAKTTLNDSIIAGESYLFGCQILTEEGTYVDNLTKLDGSCDSIVTLNLKYYEDECDTAKVTLNDSIIEGESYLFGCQILTEEGTYVDNLTKLDGSCDSIVTLNLKYYVDECDTAKVTLNDSIIEGESYLFGCQILTEAGIYVDTLQKLEGTCDSIVTLNLKYYVDECDTAKTTLNDSIIEGESYLFGCQILTEAGTYVDSLMKLDGSCDSIVTLNLKFYVDECDTAKVTLNDSIIAGESYLFGCQILTEAGIYVDTLQKLEGTCDSIVTLNLKYYVDECDTAKVTLNDSIIEGESYLFGCQILTEEGTYVDNLTKLDGSCDSIVTLNLKFYVDECDTAKTTLNDSIIEGESYLFGCQILTEAGTYVDRLTKLDGSCDSIVTLNLKYYVDECDTAKVAIADVIKLGQSYLFGCQVITPTEIGDTVCVDTLQTYLGCDSIITLTLTVNPNTVYTDTVANVCEGDMPYTWHGYVIYNDTVCSDTIDLTTYDSIVTLTLNVLRVQYAEVADSVICEGSSCNWRGKTYSKEGLYYDTLRYANGCDSIIYQLSVREAKVTYVPTEYAVSCNGGFYTWRDKHVFGMSGIYYDTVRYADCGCDSAIYMLDLIVYPTPVDSTLDTTICDGDYIEWFGHKYSVAGDYSETLYYTSGCDSVHGTLQLHVQKLTTEAPLFDTICAGSEYHWYDTTITKAGIYYDTIKYVGSDCDSIARMLILTVNQPVTVEISETWCLAAAQAAYPDLNITGTGDYTRVGTSALGCDSTTIYHLTILKTPEVPALGNLLFQPVVACGFPIILDSARVAVAAELAMTQADDIAKVDHFWFEMQLTPTSEFKQITSDVIMSYTEEPIQIRLVLYTECDDVVYGEPVAYEVVKPSPEEIAEYDEMPAVSKYNNWLLMINVNKITEMGFDVKEEDVTWYQVINDIDPAGQHIDDKEVGKGFYFTADMSLTGQYYAMIETEKTEIEECGAILRTLVVKCTTDGKMRLVPNTIHEGETMEVRNINPDENTTLWMYDRDGKLLEKHVTDGQEQYTIQPEQNAGVYLLRVVNGKQEESFKYVITK